jgi:hypothetical protein
LLATPCLTTPSSQAAREDRSQGFQRYHGLVEYHRITRVGQALMAPGFNQLGLMAGGLMAYSFDLTQ